MEKDIHEILASRLNKILKKKFEALEGFDFLETIIELKDGNNRHIRIIPKNRKLAKEFKEDEKEDLFSNKYLL